MNQNLLSALGAIPYYLKNDGLKAAIQYPLHTIFRSGRPVSVKGSKIYLRKGSSDTRIFHTIFGQQEYNIKQLDSSAKTIIDCGANIGLFTVYMKHKYPDAKVICIEPDRENYEQTLLNTKGLKDVKVYQNGIWHRKANLAITDKYNGGKWGLVVDEIPEPTNESVASLGLNELMSLENLESIDILKIDIETAEKYLFSQNYEEWMRRTKVIIIELHDWLEQGTAQPFFNAVNKIYKNYSYYIRGENTIIVNEDYEY